MKQYTFAPIRAILIAAFLAILIFEPINSYAGPSDGIVTMSYNMDGYPPFFIEKDGKFSGITVEILREAFERLNFKLAITLHPEKRGQDLLFRGQVDARGKAKEWVDHPEFYDWSVPFLEPHSVIVSPADAPIMNPTIDQMQGLTLATIHGFSYPYLDKAFKSELIHRVNVSSPKKLLLLTHKKRADGAIIDRYTALWFMKKFPDFDRNDFYISPQPQGKLDYRLMFTKKQDWKPFIKKFNTVIKQMKADGTIQNILNNYR